jgi:hypothetical protein
LLSFIEAVVIYAEGRALGRKLVGIGGIVGKYFSRTSVSRIRDASQWNVQYGYLTPAGQGAMMEPRGVLAFKTT